jgi:hypothetical protein
MEFTSLEVITIKKINVISKKIFVMLWGFFLVTGFVLAGNENPPCNCSNNDQVEMHGAGTAVWVSNFQIRCEGDAGTCWSLTYAGKWVLTIYTEPPIIFNNHAPQTDPPPAPEITQRGEGFAIYSFSSEVWKEK